MHVLRLSGKEGLKSCIFASRRVTDLQCHERAIDGVSHPHRGDRDTVYGLVPLSSSIEEAFVLKYPLWM